jgi:hypothetical protein
MRRRGNGANQRRISRAFVNFYQTSFVVGEVQGIDVCLERMEENVIAYMNNELLKEFTVVKVEKHWDKCII